MGHIIFVLSIKLSQALSFKLHVYRDTICHYLSISLLSAKGQKFYIIVQKESLSSNINGLPQGLIINIHLGIYSIFVRVYCYLFLYFFLIFLLSEFLQEVDNCIPTQHSWLVVQVYFLFIIIHSRIIPSGPVTKFRQKMTLKGYKDEKGWKSNFLLLFFNFFRFHEIQIIYIYIYIYTHTHNGGQRERYT